MHPKASRVSEIDSNLPEGQFSIIFIFSIAGLVVFEEILLKCQKWCKAKTMPSS